jgi:hypothetical protein
MNSSAIINKFEIQKTVIKSDIQIEDKDAVSGIDDQKLNNIDQ